MRKFSILASLAFAACLGHNSTPTGPTPTTSVPATITPATADAGTEETALVGPPDVKWDDMDKDQHKAWMKAKVLPTMKPLFQAYDADDFKDFDCETCHGDGAKDGTYDMPNPKLPVLPDDQAGFMKVIKDHPKMADFMMKTVKPTMANLIGEPEMDQDHPDGFSCHSCHPSK